MNADELRAALQALYTRPERTLPAGWVWVQNPAGRGVLPAPTLSWREWRRLEDTVTVTARPQSPTRVYGLAAWLDRADAAFTAGRKP